MRSTTTQPLRATNLRLSMADRKSAYRNLSGHLWHCGFCCSAFLIFLDAFIPSSLYALRPFFYITDILWHLRDGHSSCQLAAAGMLSLPSTTSPRISRKRMCIMRSHVEQVITVHIYSMYRYIVDVYWVQYNTL